MSSSVRSGVLTLLHTACGAGILAMPYAFKPYGLITGFIMIIICGICAMIGLLLQSRVSSYVPVRNASFFTLTQITNPNLSIVFDLAIAIKCFGVGVSYMIVVGDVLPQVLSTFTNHEWLLNRNVNITLVMLFIVTPLCFLKNLNSLRYASMLAISSVAYLCALVLIHFIMPNDETHNFKGDVSWGLPKNGLNPLTTLPIYVFAYTCHHNMFSVINEQMDPTYNSVKKIAIISMILAGFLYILIGGAGYLTFGDHITGNIITLYPQNISTTIGRIAIIFLVTLAFPLQCHPARASINHIIHYFKPAQDNKNSNPAGFSETTTLMDNQSPPPPAILQQITQDPLTIPTEELIEEEYPEQDHPFETIPLEQSQFTIITIGILVSAYFLAISVTSLARVLAIVGATGSTSISFILPGLFGYQLIGSEYKNFNEMPIKTKATKIASAVLVTWGTFIMFASLFASLFLGASH
ncbi:hypothetical protein Kpol_1045p20 [Vanderwaltozyma polyspora DSM 70294]|uniref:Amino acid transporter transmembrane domain-containing protein n=1 Tax=Vanderwaltozyma polyspora (strain ATCC 22028 / DSM 70294 / BCRC 21397 / CBS 2163 / NBRC 10782 / NRRL Y-8283 / UCD 57-17) TaxID=436907 RepID=A7TI27_VANPO|nr:uncharacterized protein Kpol_1045p20 [Vanderwaltozyma polyspora DSM 70294]EDO18034.1 hypothetical protein Kpol_1045p20 [Vanderwaltozyma polyspora DSM 70294]